jgi:hypothetical protein
MTFQVDLALYSSTLRRLINQQNAIGWQELFRGRFSQEWARLQRDYYWQHQNSLPTSKMTGLRWQVKIIRKLWEHWYKLWKIRNQAVHGHDEHSRREAEKRDIFRSLEEIYNSRLYLEPSVDRLLLPSITNHHQVPLWVTRSRINAHRRIFHDSAQRVRRAAIQSVRSTTVKQCDSANTTVAFTGTQASGNVHPCGSTVPHWT